MLRIVRPVKLTITKEKNEHSIYERVSVGVDLIILILERSTHIFQHTKTQHVVRNKIYFEARTLEVC
jgi:hypothetical protein